MSLYSLLATRYFLMSTLKEFTRIVSEKMRGARLDQYLIQGGIGISRNLAQQLIDAGKVTVNGRPAKPSYRVKTGDSVIANFEVASEPDMKPEKMDLKIIFEDSDLVIVDKPRGIIVHPARGNFEHTLVNALLYHCGNLPTLSEATRPGVVHRLDKETTGLLIFAKTDEALSLMGKAIEARKIKREYLALCWGDMPLNQGEIEAPIGRSILDRKKMSVTPFSSRSALTRYQVLERFGVATYLRLALQTGRTHQIRVHMAHIDHPIVGDPDYNGRSVSVIEDRKYVEIFRRVLELIDRQALHAAFLAFDHPISKKPLRLESPLPEDFASVLEYLRRDVESSKSR